MSRIFLSYARDDVEAARQLADCLAQAGHDVWWDRHLHGGSRFVTEIDKALKNAEAVIVLWSAASVGSAWVQDEAAEGRDSGRLVPIAIDSAKPPLGFRQFHTIDLGAWNGRGHPDALSEVLDAITRTSGSDARPETAEDDSLTRRVKASICVLPFINMSGEPEQEYFSDGISEDITTDLSKVSALEVVARNTAFSFKGQSPDVKEVAKQLSVSHVLEGSVRKVGGRVRINAQLIDGISGKHLWADRFDRDLTDIFAIQDEISKAIVDALKVKLLPEERKAIENRGTSNVDAYNLYLMARQQWVSGNFGDPRRDEGIVRLCQKVTALDPNYAQAWALMALAQAELRFVHGRDENALPAAERAIELNPKLPEAHCIKARYLEEEGQADEAEQQMRMALELGPESWEVNREAARMLFRQDHIDEAIPYFEKAASLMETDWHNPLLLLTCYRRSAGDSERLRNAAQMTLERSQRALAKEPMNGHALIAGANALMILGEDERALDWSQRALLLDPDNLVMRYNLGCALAWHGSPENSLNMLEPFFEKVNSSTHMRHIEVDPDLDQVRENPRFQQMLAAAKMRIAG